MTDSTNRTDERRADDGESRAASWGAAPTEAGPAVVRPGSASSFRTFVVVANVALLAVASLVGCWPSRAPDSTSVDPEHYWVRSSDSVRSIVARHVSRDSPVDVDLVLEALEALSPQGLRNAGIPGGNLRSMYMGDIIDSVRLRHFIETEFGAEVVRRVADDDREYYMLRSDDTWRSILAQVIPRESPVDVDQVLDALSGLPSEELQDAGMPDRLGELRSGDEINIVDLRRFIERLSR